MISSEELNRLELASTSCVKNEALTDIENISIAGSTPAERLASLLEQVRNPYCYRVGKTAVRISFLNSDEDLANKLQRYFVSLKNR